MWGTGERVGGDLEMWRASRPRTDLAPKTGAGGLAMTSCIPLQQLARGEPEGPQLMRLCRAGEPGRICLGGEPPPPKVQESREGVGGRWRGGRGGWWCFDCRAGRPAASDSPCQASPGLKKLVVPCGEQKTLGSCRWWRC